MKKIIFYQTFEQEPTTITKICLYLGGYGAELRVELLLKLLGIAGADRIGRLTEPLPVLTSISLS
jgi:hypothetical protein